MQWGGHARCERSEALNKGGGLRPRNVLHGGTSRPHPPVLCAQARVTQFRADALYLTAWTRSFRAFITCADVQRVVEQALVDLVAIACVLTNPLLEAVQLAEVLCTASQSKVVPHPPPPYSRVLMQGPICKAIIADP